MAIKDNFEKAISLGFRVECDYNTRDEKSELSKASFVVGLINQDNEIRHSHLEPVVVSELSQLAQEAVARIDADARIVWDEMKGV